MKKPKMMKTSAKMHKPKGAGKGMAMRSGMKADPMANMQMAMGKKK